MAYTHLTMKELGWIETYYDYDIGYKAYEIAKKHGRSNQPIYNVVNFLKEDEQSMTTLNVTKRINQNVAQRKRLLQESRLNTSKIESLMVGLQM